AITQTGQQNSYTFNLASASQLYFDSLTNDSRLSWTLSGPRGTEVSSRSFNASDGSNFSSDPVLGLIAGNYTLTVSGTGDHTGSYSFRMLNLASATPITPGNTVSSSLGDPSLVAPSMHVASSAPISDSNSFNGALQTNGSAYLSVADSLSLKPAAQLT